MSLELLVDLCDYSGALIAEKGAPVNFPLIHTFMDHGKRLKKNCYRVGETSLFKNFKNIFNEEKYFAIFAPPDDNERIASIIKNAAITKEINAELAFMRENLPYTFRHTLLVTALTIKIMLDATKGEDYNYETAALIGLTHDIGKSRVPKQILGKTTPLKKSEYELLKTHSLISYLLLCYYLGNAYNDVINAVRDHHEKLDGIGYPRGVTKISKYTKVIVAADIFDALISERPYRVSPFSVRQAIDYLINQSGAGRIDKDVVYRLISYVRKEHPNPADLSPYTNQPFRERPDSCYGRIIPDD